jgi:hypothetical protein
MNALLGRGLGATGFALSVWMTIGASGSATGCRCGISCPGESVDITLSGGDSLGTEYLDVAVTAWVTTDTARVTFLGNPGCSLPPDGAMSCEYDPSTHVISLSLDIGGKPRNESVPIGVVVKNADGVVISSLATTATITVVDTCAGPCAGPSPEVTVALTGKA